MTDDKQQNKSLVERIDELDPDNFDDPENYFRSAMLAAVNTMPYCSPAIRALHMHFVDHPQLPTMAVDKHFRVYVNPKFVLYCVHMARQVSPSNPCASCRADSHIDIAYIAGVICHEAWHPLREHHKRADNMGMINPKVWNIAIDMEINDDLMEVFAGTSKSISNICLPPMQVLDYAHAKQQIQQHGEVDMSKLKERPWVPSILDFDDGKLAETYYYQILDIAENLKNDDQLGQIFDCGPAADGQAKDYEQGEPTEENPHGLSDIEAKMVRKETASKINNATKQRGNLPGGFSRWAEQQLEPPKYDWRKEMRKILTHAIMKNTGDQYPTYRRLARRCASLNYRVALPSHQDPAPNVCIVQDTSASMDNKAIAAGRSESEGIIRAAGASVSYINCDAGADEVQQITKATQAKVYGGGGTDMRVGIKAALDQHPTPNVIVVFTDGGTPWPANPLPPGVRLIAVLVGDHACSSADVPPWIYTIKISDEDAKVREAAGE